MENRQIELRLSDKCGGGIVYIDVLRYLAICLVIALHCVVGYINHTEIYGTRTWWLCSVINSFGRMGVPVFFMLSGFLLLSGSGALDVRSFYKKRFLKLAGPFLVWDAMYYLEGCVIKGSWSVLPFFQQLVQQGSKYHLWFIYQIMGLYLLTPFLKKIVDHSSTKELLVFLAVVLLQPTVFRLINVVQPVFRIAPFLALVEGYVGFYLLGYLLGTRDIPPRLRRAIYLLGIVGMVGGTWGNYWYSSTEKISFYFSEGYSIMQYMTAGALFLFLKEHGGRLPPRAAGWARRLAGLTFGIYFIHVLVLDILVAAEGRLGGGLPLVWWVVFNIAAVCAVSTCAAFSFSKLPVLRRLI